MSTFSLLVWGPKMVWECVCVCVCVCMCVYTEWTWSMHYVGIYIHMYKLYVYDLFIPY